MAAANTGANLTSTMVNIDDIDLRIKALENTFGLKGKVCVDMNLAIHGGTKPTWKGRIFLLDGHTEMATYEGGNFATVLNRVFKDANIWLKKSEYGANSATVGQTRRTA